MPIGYFFRLLLLLALTLFASASAVPVILVYHRVGEAGGLTLGVSPAQLTERVQGLRALGYRLVTVDELAQATAQRSSEKLAAIQFDDGFESVYQNAYPALRALGVPGTVFVIWNKVSQPGFLNEAQLAELRAAGWQIGAHTYQHARLTDLAPDGLRRELARADGETCIAYPYNRHDARVRRVAWAQGLSCGVAGGPPVSTPDPQALPAPAITPWDAALLPWRARYGLGGRAPILTVGSLWPVFDQQGHEVPAPPPLTWNPAHYELLGNGAYSLTWRSERETRFSLREGHLSVNLAARRGNAYSNAVGVAYQFQPFTLALGLDSQGPLIGAAAALGGYGEVWGRWNAFSGAWAVGTTLLPVDYVKFSAAKSATEATAGLTWALPWQEGQGRPLRLGAGYSWAQSAPYAEVEWHLGSYGLGAEYSWKGEWAVKFHAVW